MMGLIKWWTSVGHAARGFGEAWRSEANLRWHGVILLITAGLAAALNFVRTQWIALLVIWAIVIATELLNTAIEKLADIIQPEIDPKIRRVKDISAAAVLVVAIAAAVAGVLLFIPPILDSMGGK